MPLANTRDSFGTIAKGFHWLTALLIATNLALGYVAITLAAPIRDPGSAATDADIARAALLFSVHKTVGVTIFFVALARILWALTQPRPGLLNGDRAVEARAAETVHWLLYGSLVAVPLSGWVGHAASTGFAPIWWPFGQSLPFVPKNEAVAATAASLHYLLQWVLIGALVLHVAGALKHHLIDADATLRRMLPGHHPARPTAAQPGHVLPALAALVIWGAVLAGAGALGWLAQDRASPASALQAVESDWQVTDGALEIAITQMGSKITGHFADWTADIAFSDTPDAQGRYGNVTVTVAIPSLSLGSSADQAMGAEYFDAAAHPTATFAADLIASETGPLARGTLAIKGHTVPVGMPFDLAIDGGTATASGALTVDRRDFAIGAGTKDAGTLGFAVDIAFRLTAERR